MNPRFSVHTSDKTSPRGFRWIWFLRLAEILLSLVVLGLAARSIAGFTAGGCSVPGKIAWNLACAVLSLLALVYLILSSGISQAFRILPWWIFIQLGLDALFFIFWIAAAGTSHLSCHDLCSACDAWGGDAWFDSLYCTCYSAYDDIFIKKRDTSPNPSLGLSGGLQKRRSRYSSAGRATGTLVAREAFDGLLVALFFFTLCATAWWMWQNRRAGDNAAATTATTSNNPENGVQQVPMEMKQDTPYSGGPAPQYTTVAPQQGNYPPVSTPNGQYPQQPQGYPQQQQQQDYSQQQQQAYPQQQQQQQQQQAYPQQQPQAYPQQQQQPYPQQQQQQQYPEQAPQGQGYYGGQQQRDITPPPQAQQHDISNYPTPTPEMQGERAAGH
ncbi:MAG: hypothetical protein HETSPECPRED_008437 [Heterodermia speciosa]|uniref:MARVEL domain-containing protein n=1 Tax=Heterodermia speciosa TaxID=116794 RepID=A0A8H3ITD1_9LECA|nr:MAG: hypothetical protein HETSPECPRED_008437 [Heterodermia speciosa]